MTFREHLLWTLEPLQFFLESFVLLLQAAHLIGYKETPGEPQPLGAEWSRMVLDLLSLLFLEIQRAETPAPVFMCSCQT